MKIPFEWESIRDSSLFENHRVKVFGGWLFSSILLGKKKEVVSETIIFIPDEDHEWEIEED